MTPNEINSQKGETLALVRDESLSQLSGFKPLWTGLIYDFPSESQFCKFIMACVNARKEICQSLLSTIWFSEINESYVKRINFLRLNSYTEH